ncbi:hypothetical protein HLB23_21970 [Nocardia uniformis]|uniref:Uncharacterized protein n=1 Tax=Nocardia uniformis TaxID=53432 RepID=A0A849C1A1_9NOCA|nr:hypothetical protein [Nocardia uniformis]NNH72492.1 hypothetical protein [Nocardia uniformis]
MIGELTGENTAAISHAELEEVITDRGRELLRQLLQDHLDLRALRERTGLAARRATRDRPGGRTRIEYGHERVLATVLGPVTVRRCALRAPGHRNIYPADATLSLPAGRHSHGIARLAVTEVVRLSYDSAHAAIGDRCGRVAGKRQIEDLTVAEASGTAQMPSTIFAVVK